MNNHFISQAIAIIVWVANPNPEKWHRVLKTYKRFSNTKVFIYSKVVLSVLLFILLIHRFFPDIFGILINGSETVAIISAAIIFLLEGKERRQSTQYEAWRVINSSQGQSGSGGRILALEELAKQGVSLAGVAAPKADLNGINLAGANLERADFQNAILCNTNFTGADLSGANFTGANLENAIFENCVLHKANLKEAKLVSCQFKGCCLVQANLERANIQMANLENTNLRCANLNSSRLDFANFNNAYLYGSEFDKASLRGTNLANSDLATASFSETIVFNKRSSPVVIDSNHFFKPGLTAKWEFIEGDPTIIEGAKNIPKPLKDAINVDLAIELDEDKA